jgi:hypothetical protein
MPKRGMIVKAAYVWEQLYKAAILETDDGKLQKCLRAAKAAIDARLHELQLDHGGTPEERQAISDALSSLNVIRRELERGSQDTGSSNA